MTATARPEPGRGSGGAGLRLALELLVYDLMFLALLPVMAAWLGWRLLVLRKPMGEWRHRFGLAPRLPSGKGPRIWLHAVSAGEMAAARPVVGALRKVFPDARIAVSTHTDTGMAVARQSCREADAVFYLPFDWPDCMGLALWRLRPDLVVVVEKELWPNFLGLARLMGARALVVNGRVSERMMRRARWAPGFVRWLYRLPDCLCVQSREDAARLRMLGVSGAGGRIVLAGSTKVDNLAERDAEVEARLARELGVRETEAWLVAGSTHPGEEELVVEAFGRIREELPSARLLLAPRHPERVAAVGAMVAERGMTAVRRSEGAEDRAEAVVLLDTMGELRAAYGFATAGFVGGTLVPVGGHSLLEPVAVGRAVLFGPHTENCEDAADLVLQAGVGFRVSGAESLAEEFLRVARETKLREQLAASAHKLIEEQRGAAARCAEVARGLIGREMCR